MNTDPLRLLDANFNRLNEGIRVIEDINRFLLNNAGLTEDFKAIRHQLTDIFSSLNLIQARNTGEDLGREIIGSGEYKRETIEDLIKSNFKRCEQSLRVLEEVSKLDSVSRAKSLEQIRYKMYELEQSCLLKKSFPNPCLYVLITQELCKLDPETVLKSVCDGGATVIQLREKTMEDGQFLKWIEKAQKIIESYDIPLIVNDRIHLVQLSGVQGVHMGQGDLSTKDARSLLKPWQWLGRSTHALEEAQLAESEGVDYIGVGPLFPTNTKVHTKAVGLDYLQEINDHINVPYVGIGSVNTATLPQILEKKPKGLAICTAIIGVDNPRELTQVFEKQIVS